MLHLFAQLIPVGGNIAVIGGGGKTGLIEALEAELSRQSCPALSTVTTRLGRDQLSHLKPVEASAVSEALEVLERAAQGERLLLAGPYVPDNSALNKYSGVPLEWFPALRQAASPNLTLLIEADGSAGRPLKCHLEYEPALPPLNLFVIAVVGLSALVRPWKESVHRPEVLKSRVSGLPEEHLPLAPRQIADVINQAWTRFKPDLIFLNQADIFDDRIERSPAGELAGLLSAGGHTVAVGSLYKRTLSPWPV